MNIGYAVSGYEKALKIGKLKEKIFNDVKLKNKNATADDLNNVLEKY